MSKLLLGNNFVSSVLSWYHLQLVLFPLEVEIFHSLESRLGMHLSHRLVFHVSLFL